MHLYVHARANTQGTRLKCDAFSAYFDAFNAYEEEQQQRRSERAQFDLSLVNKAGTLSYYYYALLSLSLPSHTYLEVF